MKNRLLILLPVIFCTVQGKSQSLVGTASGVVTISQVMQVSVSTVGTLPTLSTASDYINGKTVANHGTVSVKSNVNWLLSVKSTTTNFSPLSTGASSNMPANKLSIKKSTNSTYITLSTINQTLTTGNKGPTSASGNIFMTDIKFDPGFGYGGGLYRLGVMYTITNQ